MSGTSFHFFFLGATPTFRVQRDFFCALSWNFMKKCWHKQFFGHIFKPGSKILCRNVNFRYLRQASIFSFSEPPLHFGCKDTSFVHYLEISLKKCWHKQFFGQIFRPGTKIFCRNVNFRYLGLVSIFSFYAIFKNGCSVNQYLRQGNDLGVAGQRWLARGG